MGQPSCMRSVVDRNVVMRRMAVLPSVVVIFLSSVLVLTGNGQFLDCDTTAFSER